MFLSVFPEHLIPARMRTAYLISSNWSRLRPTAECRFCALRGDVLVISAPASQIQLLQHSTSEATHRINLWIGREAVKSIKYVILK